MLKTHSDFLSTVTVKCQFFRSRFRQTACTILSTKSKSVCSSKKMEILDEVSNIYVNLKTGVLKIGAIINIIYILSQQQDVNGCNQGKQHHPDCTRGTSSFIFWCILFIAIRFSCHSVPFPDIWPGTMQQFWNSWGYNLPLLIPSLPLPLKNVSFVCENQNKMS